MMMSFMAIFGVLMVIIGVVSSELVAHSFIDHLLELHQQFAPGKTAVGRMQVHAPSTHLRDASASQYVNIRAWPSYTNGGTPECTGTPLIQEYFAMGVCFLTPYSSDLTRSAQFSWDSDTDEVYINFYTDVACTLYADQQAFLGGVVPDSCFFGIMVSLSTYIPPPINEDGKQIELYTTSSGCATGSTSSLLVSAWASTAYLTGDDFHTDDGNPFAHDDAGSCVFYEIPYSSKYYAVNFTISTYYVASYTTYTVTETTCFAASETVALESGAVVPISSVVVGNRVLTADAAGHNAKFSTVIAVPHDADNQLTAVFTHMTTASGKDVKMTPEHLVSVSAACDGTTALKQAGEVENGMCLVSVDGLEKVVDSNMVHGKGVHTLVTEKQDEMIVVNGIVASPFAYNHVVANAYYNIIRCLPASVMKSSLIKQANSLFGSMVAEFSRS